MAFYRTCPRCGAALDPGEHCDCESEERKRQEFFEQRMQEDSTTGQYTLRLDGIECGRV